MLLNLELRKSFFYIGLDLLAAFDTFHHDILMSILGVSRGFRGSVPSCLKSYLSSRIQKVLIKDVLSSEQEIKTGATKITFMPITFHLFAAIRAHI